MASVSCYTELTHSPCYSLKYTYEGLLAEIRWPVVVSIKQSQYLMSVSLWAYFLLLVQMFGSCSHTLRIKAYVCFNSMNTWIECVDFQELLLTGLEKPFLKLGKVSLHCVFICNWRKKKEMRKELWITQVYSLNMIFRRTAKTTCAEMIMKRRRVRRSICVFTLTPDIEKNAENALLCFRLNVFMNASEGKGGKQLTVPRRKQIKM